MMKGDDDLTDLTDDFSGSPNSQDAPPKNGLFRQLLQAMNPASCLAPGCTNPLVDDDEVIDYDATVIPMLKELKSEKKRTLALQKLFKLTDKESQQHRVPVVCSKSFNIIEALLPCLAPEASGNDRRQALLLLNNLCIPPENKKELLLGESRDPLLNSILLIFVKRLAEAHIAAACLYNLSFLEEAKIMLLSYQPENLNRITSAKSSYSFHSPTTQQNSLLRIVEEMVVYFTPYMSKSYQKKISTVEAATIRWAMALMRNLVTVHDNAAIVASTTKFPTLAAQYLQESERSLELWSIDSLEDSSLLFLLMLIQAGDESCKAIDNQELRTALKKVGTMPGIHGVRAGVILERLNEVSEDVQLRSEHLMEVEAPAPVSQESHDLEDMDWRSGLASF
mmetsp:Transcript_39504/g.82041  ORF Transcript_39504/g.82041 Transcript_39504/m.82041 type:complete len:394 (+) Transcript_39504:188-1369(+)